MRPDNSLGDGSIEVSTFKPRTMLASLVWMRWDHPGDQYLQSRSS